MNRDQARADLGTLAALLRTYVEWHGEAGTTGFPRERSPGGSQNARAASDPDAPGAPGVASDTTASTQDGSQGSALGGTQAIDKSLQIRLPELSAEVANCTRCALAATRTQTVFSRGNPRAALCFVGEAPGADEDEQGLPFVGRAGQLLDRMIAAMGLSPERDVYVCNIIKCRPPGNRRPEPEETAACLPYLHEQIALVKPRIIVALGNTAVASLLETKLGITKVRGEWKLYRGKTLVMPTYHPSYLLRPGPQQLEAKRQTWQDLQAVMRELSAAGAGKTGG